MISLISFFFRLCVLYCLRCLKNVLQLHEEQENTNQPENDKDLRQYILQLHEEQELHKKTLKSLLKSKERVIQKAEKQQPKNLLNLIKESSGFEGVKKFDNGHVPTFSSKEHLDCWSLPVVTLTAIVVSLPNIQKDKADNFLESVSEAFKYVTFVEENLNATSDYVSIQKAAKKLWREVEIDHKWLGEKLNDLAGFTCFESVFRWVQTPWISRPKRSETMGNQKKRNIRERLQEFRETAKNIDVTEVGSTESGGPSDDSICRSICANSMYRITKTIMDSYKDKIDQVSEEGLFNEGLFNELSSMISDIVAACLTNLPQAIVLKCHSSEIEEREANVHAAAQLLGETTQIIEVLEDRELPSLNQDDIPFIHKWRAYLRNP